jgi:NAD-dependent dihydropyrimidine dehydrogenase PreA subunit
MAEPLPDSCSKPAGQLRPVVDPARCEAKTTCVAACPVDVFEVSRIRPDVFQSLPVMAKLKVWVHGMKTATTPRADACLGCGLCVTACPETAIRLLSSDRVSGQA